MAGLVWPGHDIWDEVQCGLERWKGYEVPAFVGVTPIVLMVMLWAVYMVRVIPRNKAGSNAPIRTGRMNSNVFPVVIGVLGMGGMAFVAAGIMTDSRLLTEVSLIPFDLLFIYIIVMFVWWTRKG